MILVTVTSFHSVNSPLLWLPAAAFGSGSGIKGFIGFGFELQRLGGELFGEVEVLRANQKNVRKCDRRLTESRMR